jgi:hypothetical protein
MTFLVEVSKPEYVNLSRNAGFRAKSTTAVYCFAAGCVETIPSSPATLIHKSKQTGITKAEKLRSQML